MSRGKRMLSMILSDSNKESVIAKRKASYSRSDDKEKSEETVQLFESNRNSLSQKIYDSEEEFEELWQATEKIVHEAQNKTKFIEDSHDSSKDTDYSVTMPNSDCVEIQSMATSLDANTDRIIDDQGSQENNGDYSSVKDTRKSRKNKRNQGQAYITENGKFVQQRKLKELTDCRMKCKSKISLSQQKLFFDEYWGLGSYNLRLAFITGFIAIAEKKMETKVKNTNNPRNRIYSNKYFIDVEGKRIQICQKCFRFTLDETNQFIKTVVRKKLEFDGSNAIIDQRGRHKPTNKVAEEKINEVREHIKSFPAYESHYTRRNTSLKYLQSNLTLSLMYRLYCESRENPVSSRIYYDVFHTLNLKIKPPKVDTCSTCDLFKIKINAAVTENGREELKLQQEQHHKQAELAYECKRMDKNLAKAHSNTEVYTFDLEQCLPTPFLTTSVSFYKRPLWTYNLTVHNCNTGQPHCFMWHEAIARRGGNEIASSLFKHSLSLSETVKYLKFYSDSCFGQNKNTFVATMFLLLMQLKPNFQVIDHKFLIPGHTHMECDVDHSIIERKKKKTTMQIHHPRDWYNFVRGVGVKKMFMVYEMEQDGFFDFAKLSKEKFTWRKVDQNGNKFSWKTVKWLRFTREFGLIQYKNTLNEEDDFNTLNVRRRGCNSISQQHLKQCYSSPNKISREKKKDLLDSLPLINSNFHEFYQNLQCDDIPNYHPDLTEMSENEE